MGSIHTGLPGFLTVMSSCDESEYSITTVASRTAAKTEIIITAFFFMSAKIDGCPQLSNYFNHIVISMANVWQND